MDWRRERNRMIRIRGTVKVEDRKSEEICVKETVK